MIVASIQPCFIPWLGYFEQMLIAERFIFLDDVQYTKKDWRNSNQLLTPNGVKKVFVPISNASRGILINEAIISPHDPWQNRFENQLLNWYKKAPFFKDVSELVLGAIHATHTKLVDLNYDLFERILSYLNVDTELVIASEVPRQTENKSDRIIEFCRHYDGHLLYDGKSAANFIDVEYFRSKGLDVLFQDYSHPSYEQLGKNAFQPHLSVVDLLMNHGPESKNIILNNSNLPDNDELNLRKKKVSSM